MSHPWKTRWVATLATGLLCACALTRAEDIDIFVGGTVTESSKPNILFVLDNSANWSRNSQHWQPSGVVQGQAEVRAIRNALADLTDKVNVGVMMYSTQEPYTNSGYVRHALKTLNSTNQAALNARLDRIYDNINEPSEKRQGNPKFGSLMHDVFNYLNGDTALEGGAGTPASLADPAGYRTPYSEFSSPLTTADLCADTYVVFIGNPQSNGPTTDDGSNSDALDTLVTAAGGTPDRLAERSGGTPIPIPRFTPNSQTEQVELDFSAACYSKQSDCTAAVNTAGSACLEAGYTSCACLSTTKTPNTCSNKKHDQYMVQGTILSESMVPTGEYDTNSGADWNLDDWAKFLYVHGVPVPGASETDPRARVITYTIDVFNKQQNADHTGLLMSASKVGGGRYFMARSQEALEAALGSIINEILSVNSTFASASLPISATNRAQNENQVFIGMFRPDPQAKPRWFGNLKRYQLGWFDGVVDLADADGSRAVNIRTGFVADCASSFWTSDSDAYWDGLGVNPDPRSQCRAATDPYSDKPDGPFVEKGAAGQMLRESEISDRTVYTLNPDVLADFMEADIGLDSELVDYTGGVDVDDLDTDNDRAEVRPTAHGDVVHARPLPINYGSSTGVTVFYGANDGPFRAIDAGTGEERWSFIAPEHFDKLTRLRVNAPLVSYPTDTAAAGERLPKDYFFDGPIGQVIRYNDDDQVSQAWIYPTMRRGGRMLYAFDVTSPDAPELMWRTGCPLQGDDSGCSTGLSGIGQTWSVPNAGYIKGYEDGATPILVVGGGYDGCEDADSATPSCESSKGRAVFILNAETGALVRSFATDRAVPADVSLVDLDYDGYADVAYAADTGGNLYRVSFIDPVTGGPVAPDAWSILPIARTLGGGRKFLYGPAVMPYRGMVYLALGSGNRERPLETNYPYATDVQDRFYVFLDTPREDPDSVAEGTYPVDLDNTSAMFDYSTETQCESPGVFPAQEQRGWFLELPSRGEQTVTNAIIVAGLVTFSTSRPGGTAVGVCSRPIGIASSYWVNLFNASGAIGVEGTCGGTRSAELAGGGLPPPPVLATVPIDGRPTTVVIGAAPRDGSVGTPISPQEVRPVIIPIRTREFWSTDADL